MKDLMISDLQKLIQIPSVAQESTCIPPFGEQVNAALQTALDICAAYGFKTKNCDHYIGWAEAGQGAELMGILVHLDVVPAGGGWTREPFGGEIADGKLYGRGAVDDKGPAVACIHAVKELMDEGAIFDKRVRIIFGLNEESGDWVDMEHYKRTEEIPAFGFTPDADFPVIYGEKGIVQVMLSMPLKETGLKNIAGGEAPNMVPDRCEATLAVGGRDVHIKAKGVSAHGSTPEEGVNAISKVMDEIGEEADSKFAKFYNETIGTTVHGEHIGLGIFDEQSGKLTLNAGTVQVEDEKVKLTLDIRYPVTFKQEEVLSQLEQVCEKYGVSVEVGAHIAPVFMDRNGRIVKELLGAYRKITGDDAEPSVMGGGTYARAMEHIVAFGPVFPGREPKEHKPDEYILLEDMQTIKEIYKLAIKRLAVD